MEFTTSASTMPVSDKTTKDPALFSVQHFCLHDGPGTRSIVFFKGCPLRCAWCSNPESWSRKPELAFKHTLCIDCKTCVDVCPENAISAPGEWDKDKCTLCFKCVDACPSGAMTRFGDFKTSDEILKELRPEYSFYKTSNGGVTFSGGEVTLFPEYALDLTKRLKEDDVHVAMETCGQFKLEHDTFEKISNSIHGDAVTSPVWKLISSVDLVLFDLKVFDSNDHKDLCGVKNNDIKLNFITLTKLAKENLGPKVWPRLPLIPGNTDSPENLKNWAEFLLDNGVDHLTIVPYHNLGGPKRAWIGVDGPPDIPSLSDEHLQQSIKTLTEAGIRCCMPGEEGW